LRHGTLPLINLQQGEFIYFYYAMAGLLPPVSSFLFMLLVLYGLQLQHLSPDSTVLVAIFIDFCEMFICVPLLVTLFRMLHMLRWSRKGSGLIGTYYIQIWAKGPIAYITPSSSGK
jgi:hypothetical protein